MGNQPLEETGAKLAGEISRKMNWDLTDLYESLEDPRLDRDLKRGVLDAERFASDYRRRLNGSGRLKPQFIAGAMARYEELLETTFKPVAFARLLHSADTSRQAHGALLSKAMEVSTRVQTTTMFFELDWIALDDETAERIYRAECCARWRHFLKSVRRYKPHTLTEKEEIVLAERNQTGRRAFQRLFDETTSSQRFVVRMNGKKHSLNQSEVLALLHNPDRQFRRAAHRGFSKGLESNLRLATFVMNTLVQDHGIENRLKNYSDPEESRHLANEIEAGSVRALLSACESRNGLVQRYYFLKSRLLGISPLYDYDRYAPVNVQGGETPRYGWEDACRLVYQSYQHFSPTLGDIVREFLEKNWIDAEPRNGKRGGAFCSSTVPSAHPYVLMNYTGRLNDVMTLAHELGHGVHQYLSRPRGILQCTTPLTLAETASVFGEMLVFHRLVEDQKDPRARLALYCNKLEDSFATVFRQVGLTRFEQRVHRDRASRELTPDELGDIWIDVNRDIMGDSVRLTRGYRLWWSYISHFIHVPFYCYAYAFGELLVLSLWRQFQALGEEFVPRYLKLLEAGGSDDPATLLRKLDQDISQTDFWNSGLSVLEGMLEEAENLAGELGY